MSTPRRTVRTPTDVARAALALGSVAAVVLGIPAVLLRVADDPLPTELPRLETLTTALSTPDDGTLFLRALVLLAWAGWATFVLALAVEVPAQWRGRRTPRLPGLGFQQHLASRLVACLSVLVSAPVIVTVPAATVAVAAQPASAIPPPIAAASSADGAHDHHATPGAPGPPVADIVVVRRGDTLTGIAEDRLGDAHRYPELVEATSAVVQPDGRHLTDPDLIYPGWQVRLPTARSSPAPAPAPASAPSHAAGIGDAPASPVPSTSATESPTATPTPSADPTVPPAASPATTRPQPGGAGASESAPTPTSTAPAPDADLRDTAFIAVSGGLSAVAAAGLVALLARKRARQQRHRRPGQRVPSPSAEAQAAVQQLRTRHEPLTVDNLDSALRGLADSAADAGRAVPRVQLARLLSDHLELHLAEPSEPLPPFRAVDGDDALWVLNHDVEPPELFIDRTAAAPYPALVSLGRDLDGALVLLDLEEARALSLHHSPPPERTDPDGVQFAAVLDAMAVELATSQLADDLDVTLVGASSGVVTALGVDRVRHVLDVDPVLDDLEQWAHAVRRALDDAGSYSARDARSRRVAPDTWTPHIVLLQHRTTAAQDARLQRLLDAEPLLPLAVVTTSSGLDHAWSLTLVQAPDVATLQPAGLTVQVQTFGEDLARQVVQALRAADAEPVTPSPPPGAGDPPDDTVNLAEASGTPELDHRSASTTLAGRGAPAGSPDDALGLHPAPHPTVRVLGPVEVAEPRGELSADSHRARMTEVVTFLALHPHREHHLLDEALWPGERVPDPRRHQLISRARRWLGTDEGGQPYVPIVAADGYRLAETVTTDWDMFRRYVGPDPTRVSTDDLVAALALVRGQPFAGTNPRRYAWADVDRQEMIAAVADVAHELGSRALQAGDAVLARRAATTGLAVEPGSEVLWRDALLAERLAGNREGIVLLADRLNALADELGGDLEPETLDLLDDLLRRHAGAGR